MVVIVGGKGGASPIKVAYQADFHDLGSKMLGTGKISQSSPLNAIEFPKKDTRRKVERGNQEGKDVRHETGWI